MSNYVLAPDVILVPVNDGSARLLDLGGEFHALPEAGVMMLRETLAHGEQAACRRVAAEFDVDPGQVRGDLRQMLADLERRGLIRRGRASGHRPIFPHVLLAPLVWAIGHWVRSLDRRAALLLGVVRISFAIFGWARTVAAFQRIHARAMASGTTSEAEIAAIDQAVRRTAARHWFNVECKERAICCWTLLRQRGMAADLVVGMQAFPMAGHCWCEAQERLLSDDLLHCQQFAPVARYA